MVWAIPAVPGSMIPAEDFCPPPRRDALHEHRGAALLERLHGLLDAPALLPLGPRRRVPGAGQRHPLVHVRVRGAAACALPAGPGAVNPAGRVGGNQSYFSAFIYDDAVQ